MRRKIFFSLLFLGGNFLLGLVHINVFQSAVPFAAWFTIGLHIVGLIFFPYRVFFTSKPTK